MNATAVTTPHSLGFRHQHQATWRELEALTDRALHGGLRRLESAELARLPVLYRQVVASLAVARATALDRALVEYLEALTARAHVAVYAGRRPGTRPIRRLLFRTFPAALRSSGAAIAISAALLLLGAAVAALLVWLDPTWYYAFVDVSMAAGRDPSASTEALRHTLYDSGASARQLSDFAASLFAHNARIGMAAFALGIAAGVPTSLLLFTNGLTLGAFVALFAQRGLLLELLGWLLPHGIPELTAVVLCGAAGLLVAKAVVFPGDRSVAAALRDAGGRAAALVMGSIVLFGFAGIIEGVFRQVVVADSVRWGLCALDVVLMAAWFGAGTFGGPKEDEG